MSLLDSAVNQGKGSPLLTLVLTHSWFNYATYLIIVLSLIDPPYASTVKTAADQQHSQ